jgi:hypothetical protein
MQEVVRSGRLTDGLDHALSHPSTGWMRRDPDVPDLATLEGDDDERIERPEVHGDEGKESSGPGGISPPRPSQNRT